MSSIACFNKLSHNEYFSNFTEISEKQIQIAKECLWCKKNLKTLFSLIEKIKTASFEEQSERLREFKESPSIKHIQLHHPDELSDFMESQKIRDFISTHTGLNTDQLNQAQECPQCIGNYSRLLYWKNRVQQASSDTKAAEMNNLSNSKAIGFIRNHHPFDLTLLEQHTSFSLFDLEPILNCNDRDCKCQRIWLDFQNALNECNKSSKDSIHLLYISLGKVSDLLKNSSLHKKVAPLGS